MKKYIVAISIYMAFSLLAGGSICQAAELPKAGQTTFDKEQAGKQPAGSTVFAGDWVVRAESAAPSSPNALCQTGYADYPAISLSDKVYTDLTITTRFKAISGDTDRAAGIIFRIQDKDNYYILRANALEDNVNIYRYIDGRRWPIQESSVKVPSGTWHELRVEVKGNHIRGILNGKLVVEATDDTFKSGKAGLWTKADSVTCFDNVQFNTAK